MLTLTIILLVETIARRKKLLQDALGATDGMSTYIVGFKTEAARTPRNLG